MEDNKQETTNTENVKEAEVINNTETKSKNETNPKSMAICSLVCSLVGLLIAGLPLGIIAIGAGATVLSKFKSEEKSTKYMAIAGIIVGIVDVIGVIYQIILTATK